ncbi:hypothetical protein Hdeb2414_s0025g00663711 [Helianthus debilis subsp. tardiflorus]
MDLETCDNILASCIISCSIRWCILVWLKISLPSNQFSIKGLWNLLRRFNGSKRCKKVVGVVFLNTFWTIWMHRNELQFNGRIGLIAKALEEMQEMHFLSVECRSKFKDLDWGWWREFNVRNLIN